MAVLSCPLTPSTPLRARKRALETLASKIDGKLKGSRWASKLVKDKLLAFISFLLAIVETAVLNNYLINKRRLKEGEAELSKGLSVPGCHCAPAEKRSVIGLGQRFKNRFRWFCPRRGRNGVIVFEVVPEKMPESCYKSGPCTSGFSVKISEVDGP